MEAGVGDVRAGFIGSGGGEMGFLMSRMVVVVVGASNTDSRCLATVVSG